MEGLPVLEQFVVLNVFFGELLKFLTVMSEELFALLKLELNVPHVGNCHVSLLFNVAFLFLVDIGEPQPLL